MNNLVATVIDTTGIQKYIFGSNRLRENIGGSYLVQIATSEWVKECFLELGEVYIPDEETDDFGLRITTNLEIVAELVYTGGGNTVLLFRSEEYAKEFTKKLTSKILHEAPGLNIVIAHEVFDWDTDLLQEVIDKKLIQGKLENEKRKPRPSMPILGLSVTATCNSTGLVAVDTSNRYGIPENDSYLVSREIVAKLKTVDRKYNEPANQLLKNTIFKNLDFGKYEIPYDVDDLGRSEGESSYIAIVHADGNRLGNRFQEYLKTASDNEDCIVKMRKFSIAVDSSASKALRAVAETVLNSITIEDHQAVIKYVDTSQEVINKVTLQKRNGQTYLPFRPIVYGGDDITFVCDGRLGLSLATKFLNKFEEFTADLPDIKNKVTACAGIAIVKNHYPFAKAYALSESLCGKAKKWMKKQTNDYEKPLFSALDWHIAASGLIGSINEIRQREYEVQIPERKEVASLAMRPMHSGSYEKEWRTWTSFAKVVHEFNTHEDWKDRRNKVMALRDVLRQGHEATKQFRQVYRLKSLPAFPEADNKLGEEGWHWNGICAYFDAIEAMEFYIPLGESTDE
ncbi:hypothetical protein VB713_25740 [Anabaena cylindrica UHCC 0172]|uniref:Cas10/Cmr2 second palm domain-containing protein n=1 Tax=Anabaena cylindrica TaxID=1165 RepID=UPI002B1FC426|nr:hypothetical protein [Anabaena cylindrica]MEA5554340.1 hypothetical protein [Anabaena cylindrica UHCC 0172]